MPVTALMPSFAAQQICVFHRIIEKSETWRGRLLGTAREQLVKRERHLLAVEVDLQHAVNRFPDEGELVERGAEKFLLHHAIDGRDQNDKAGMQRLRRIELPEITGVVGDEDEIAIVGVAHDIPVFPAGAANMRDVLRFMAGFPGDGDQVDAEAFVDQKPHNTAMVSSRRRAAAHRL